MFHKVWSSNTMLSSLTMPGKILIALMYYRSPSNSTILNLQVVGDDSIFDEGLAGGL